MSSTWYTSSTRMALAAVGLSLSALALAPGQAQAQSTCDWYGKTALRQAQENDQRKCGLKGSEWSADLKAHMAWCASVAPDVWKKAAQTRDAQLASCGAGGATAKAAPTPIVPATPAVVPVAPKK